MQVLRYSLFVETRTPCDNVYISNVFIQRQREESPEGSAEEKRGVRIQCRSTEIADVLAAEIQRRCQVSFNFMNRLYTENSPLVKSSPDDTTVPRHSETVEKVSTGPSKSVHKQPGTSALVDSRAVLVPNSLSQVCDTL